MRTHTERLQSRFDLVFIVVLLDFLQTEDLENKTKS